MNCSPLQAKQYFPRQRWSAFIYWETRGSLCEKKFATQKVQLSFLNQSLGHCNEKFLDPPLTADFLLGTYSRWRQKRIPAWAPLMVPAPWHLLIVVDNHAYRGKRDNLRVRSDQDQWSEITRIIVDQMNGWIHSGQWSIGSFDLPWSEWSRITDPDRDHIKGTQRKTTEILR